MKKVLASLFAVYSATHGQQPAAPVTPQLPIVNPPLQPFPALTTSAPATTTTAAVVQPSTTAQLPPLPPPPPLVPPAMPQTTGPAATAPATTATATETTAAGSTTTTEAPYYINPYCPAGYALSQLGAANPVPSPPTANAECRSNVLGDPASKAVDHMGTLLCDNWSCCLCQEILCGGSGTGCDYIKFGDSAAIGVQNIIVMGTPGVGGGAHIECAGLESCKGTNLEGTDVGVLDCTGEHSCEGAQIEFTPAEGMVMECSGLRSCANAGLEIVVEAHAPISRITSIDFNGQEAAEGAVIQIQNLGTEPLIIENLECAHPTACTGITFEFVGNIQVLQCEMLGITDFTAFPEAIRTCLFGPSTTAVPAASTTASVPAQSTTAVIPQPPASTVGNPQTTPVFSVQPIVPTQPQQTRPVASSTTAAAAASSTTSAPVNPVPTPPVVVSTTSAASTTSAPVNPVISSTTAAPVVVTPMPTTPAPTTTTPAPTTPAPTTPAPTTATPAPTTPAPTTTTTPFPTTANPTPAPVVPVTNPNLPAIVPQLPTNLKCTESTCASRRGTVSPANNFVLECQGQNGCGGMTLDLNVWYDPISPGNMVTSIDGFKFFGRAAGAGATVNINNGLYGLWKTQVSVKEILCDGVAACDGLTINAGIGVNLFNTKVSCTLPGACDRCKVVMGSVSVSCLEMSKGNVQYQGYTQAYGIAQTPAPSQSLYLQYQNVLQQQQLYQQQNYPFAAQLI